VTERHEGVVRMDSELQALVAEMNSLVAIMEGMKADNQYCASQGIPPSHDSGGFGAISTEFDKLAKRFRTEI